MTKNKIMLKANNLKGFDGKGRSWEEVDKIVKKMRQPDYHQKSRGLTWNATPTDKAKYEIQQNILRHKRENEISDSDLKKLLGIRTKKKLECLLFAHIENFDLDELVSYATELFAPFELKIVRPGQEIHSVVHKNNNQHRKKYE